VSIRAKHLSPASAFVLLGLAGGLPACASASGDEAPSNARLGISGGQPDPLDSNVFLLVSQRAQRAVALCSASLIAPNLLLTARHCVSEVSSEQVTCGQTTAGEPFAPERFFATNALSIDDVSSAFRVSSISVPTDSSDICGFDIALVTLTTLVPPSVAQPLVPRIDRQVEVREIYSAVGYGQDSAGEDGVAGQRRARSGLAVMCIPGKCGFGVEANEFVGDAGICSGDSGGPALDDAGKVVGVVSRSGNDCAHPVYASVASWKEWISEVALQAAEQGKYEAPFWVASGLSDPALEPSGSAGASNAPLVQGDKCDTSRGCSVGYACFSPSNTASDAYCAAQCSSQSNCSTGTSCRAVGGGQVCVSMAGASGTPSEEGSSCSVAAAGRLGNAFGGAFSLLTAMAALARGRRAFRDSEGS